MGLTIWDGTADYFSHSELRDNLQLIDGHDHSSGKGAPIPSAGLATNAVTSPKILDGSVTSGKLADQSVSDTKLDRSAVATYRPVCERFLVLSAWTGASSYVMLPTSSSTLTSQTLAGSAGGFFDLDPNDHYLGSWITSGGGYVIGAHAPRYKLKMKVLSNGTAPTASTVSISLRRGCVPNTPVGNNAPGMGSAGSAADLSVSLPATANVAVGTQTTTDLSLTAGTFMILTSVNNGPAANSQLIVRAALEVTNI